MRLLSLLLTAMLDIVPAGEAFLTPLQHRDSILIADQLKYGFKLDNVECGTGIGLADFSQFCDDTLVLVRNWQLDTLSGRRGSEVSVEGYVVLAPFEEGIYSLPPIYLLRENPDGKVDTLMFSAVNFEAKTMPVDTAAFKIAPLKGQISYPLTFAEIAPYLFGGLGAVALIALAVIFLPKLLRKRDKTSKPKDPAHVVALRELDRYRNEKYWAPAQQKAFYSGITDIVKQYIDARYGIDAPEMTTDELFAELKDVSGVSPDLYLGLKSLFERADFVKFARHFATDEENATALPLCIRFVTDTYQAQVEEEGKKNVL